MLKSILPTLALGLAVLCCAPSARAVESYDACTGTITSIPTTIATQGVWCLKADIATSITSGNAINVTANNVTIACNGFKIGGLGGGVGSTAIGIESTKLNTRVVGCHLRGFATAVGLGGDGGLVQDSIIESSVNTGLHLSGTGHVVRNNRFIDIGGANFQTQAIQLSGSATVYDNLIDGVSAIGSTVIGVNASGGVLVMHDNTIQGLVADPEQDVYGVLVFEGQVIFERNRIISPYGAGALGCTSSMSVVRDNIFMGFVTPLYQCDDNGGNVVVLPPA